MIKGWWKEECMGNTVRKFFNAKEQKLKRQYLRNNATPAERLLWSELRKKKLDHCKFRRQHGVGPYITDFYCPEMMLAIEVDGGSHNSVSAQEYDQNRDMFFHAHGITTIRFRNEEIMNDVNEVLRRIAHILRVRSGKERMKAQNQ